MGWWDRINFDASQPYYIGERRAALYGTDEAYLVQLMNGVKEGNFPQRDDEVVLNSEAKIALDVGIGDRVTVRTPAGDAEFTVSGFGTDDSDYYKGQTFMVAVYMTRNAFHTLMAQNGLSESPVCTIQFQSAEKASKARAELQESGGVPKETILENKAVMGIAGQSDNEAISGIYGRKPTSSDAFCPPGGTELVQNGGALWTGCGHFGQLGNLRLSPLRHRR